MSRGRRAAQECARAHRPVGGNPGHTHGRIHVDGGAGRAPDTPMPSDPGRGRRMPTRRPGEMLASRAAARLDAVQRAVGPRARCPPRRSRRTSPAALGGMRARGPPPPLRGPRCGDVPVPASRRARAAACCRRPSWSPCEPQALPRLGAVEIVPENDSRRCGLRREVGLRTSAPVDVERQVVLPRMDPTPPRLEVRLAGGVHDRDPDRVGPEARRDLADRHAYPSTRGRSPRRLWLSPLEGRGARVTARPR